MKNENFDPTSYPKGEFVSREEASELAKHHLGNYLESTGANSYGETKAAVMEMAAVLQSVYDHMESTANAVQPDTPDLQQCSMRENQVLSRPMTRKEYNDYRGWGIPEGENPDDAGHLVIFGAFTAEHYETWYPEKVFAKLFDAPVETFDGGEMPEEAAASYDKLDTSDVVDADVVEPEEVEPAVEESDK